ncbi:MAG: hypothetical protein SPI35_06030 [Porphyromonas sp.]|nr:hypothetical protein [Porphyromonas sp.]
MSKFIKLNLFKQEPVEDKESKDWYLNTKMIERVRLTEKETSEEKEDNIYEVELRNGSIYLAVDEDGDLLNYISNKE